PSAFCLLPCALCLVPFAFCLFPFAFCLVPSAFCLCPFPLLPSESVSISIGTSGWNYPSGAGTWNGVFYPSRRARGFDELAWYAEHFDTVEVNSTFYRMPEAANSLAWLRRTPASFQFSIKLFQKFTHPDMYLA